jgi:hypothetical protein
MAIRTTEDWLTWSVNTANYGPTEVLEYIQGLTYNTTNVRQLTVAFVDKLVVINGIPVTTDGETAGFDNVTKSYQSNGDHRVRAMHYWSDRDLVLVEYLADHPSSPSPRNTEHTSAEFGTFFNSVFDYWKVCAEANWQILADIEAQKEYFEANPTFISTEEKEQSL